MRSEVTRKERHTTVQGWELVDGEMVPRAYDYARTFNTVDTLERAAMRDHPRFVVSEWSEYTVLYTMPVEQFREQAMTTIIED